MSKKKQRDKNREIETLRERDREKERERERQANMGCCIFWPKNGCSSAQLAEQNMIFCCFLTIKLGKI